MSRGLLWVLSIQGIILGPVKGYCKLIPFYGIEYLTKERFVTNSLSDTHLAVQTLRIAYCGASCKAYRSTAHARGQPCARWQGDDAWSFWQRQTRQQFPASCSS